MKIGFIGSGNMGGAILGGMIEKSIVSPCDIIVSDKNEKRLEQIKKSFGVNTTTDNKKVSESDLLFICVKPNVLLGVIDEISNSIKENTTIVSIVAGKSISNIENAFAKKIKLIRVMPNTPALVGEGMAALVKNENVSEEMTEFVKNIFSSLGRAEIVSEKLMDCITGVSGSSPAYVFMFIEAMADAAVKGGMPRDMAYTFAAQSVLGSAKMVLDTKKHPGELKDMVCSPGGTTIDAVAELEKNGFRSAVISAIDACIEKSKNL